MNIDIGRAGWPAKAACRWAAYASLWTLTVVVCAASALHAVLAVGGAMMGCVLAASLPLMFATMFEVTYSRRGRWDAPLLCCPCIGAVINLIGVGILLHSSALLVSEIASAEVESARDLCARYAGVPLQRLPRAMCVRHAFVKTDWEAGEIECQAEAGRVLCEATFAAAPVFDSKEMADTGNADEIFAWAVTHGAHVDANYRPEGPWCGYLSGMPDFEFFMGKYRLAVQRVMKKHQLVLSQTVGGVEAGQAAGAGGLEAPLEGRPIMMAVDPLEVRYELQCFVVAAFILLCCCPCTGPLPLGLIFAYWCWARGDDRYSAVAPDDADDDYLGGMY